MTNKLVRRAVEEARAAREIGCLSRFCRRRVQNKKERAAQTFGGRITDKEEGKGGGGPP